MIQTFLICLIVAVANNCTTIHPDLGALIPKDLLSNDDHNAYAQTPELKCLQFNDGKLAVITVVSEIGGGSQMIDNFFNRCDGHAETIAWFGQHGYKIVEASDLEVYMQR